MRKVLSHIRCQDKNQDIEPRISSSAGRASCNRSYGLKARLFGPEKISPEEIKNIQMTFTTAHMRNVRNSLPGKGINTIELWESNRANLVKHGTGPFGKQSLFPKLIEEGHNPYMKQQKDRLAWMTPDIKIADKSDIAYFIGCTAGYNQQVLGSQHGKDTEQTQCSVHGAWRREWCCGSALHKNGAAAYK